MTGGDRRETALWRHRRFTEIWVNPSGWRALTIVNHSVIGQRFVLTGLAYFVFGGLLAMLIRAQLSTPDSGFLDHDGYSQVFTVHATVMMFLFAIPVVEGMAIYLLPKLLGARDLAFPRVTAFGYWCYLFGGLIILAGFAAGLAPNSGWFMYVPLSSQPYTPGINADIWLLGITFVEISAMAAGVELTVSVLKLRAAGMSLRRMPLFGWYILVTAMMIVLGFPPLILGSVLLEIERAFNWPFFDVARGGDPLLWQHLFWLFGHPEVYIIFLPGAAIVSTVLPALARREIVGHAWIVASVVATGFISFLLWVHHMFTVGIPHLAQTFFSVASMLVAVPTAVQFFAWIATLWSGRPVMCIPMLYLFGFLFIFVAGGLTGVMVALVPFNWQVHDTHFVVAHLHYVLVGGFVFPLFAGIYYWMPAVVGRMPSQRQSAWGFWLIFTGFNMTFFLMHLTGLLGMPRRVYTYPAGLGWEWLNLVSSIGGFIMTAGIAVAFLDLLVGGLTGRRAPRNPWRAGTLEWAMPAPPPNYNFASLPEVSSRAPLHDDPELPADMAAGRHYLGQPRGAYRETLGVDVTTGRPDQVVILAAPSWLPLLAALPLAAFFVGFLFKTYLVAAAGALVALAILFRWAWANGMRSDPEPVTVAHGVLLTPHVAVKDPPGWWGMVIALLADLSLLLSLVFGYLYLWAIAPAWPPSSWIDAHPALPWTAAVALVALGLCAHLTVGANASGRSSIRFWSLVATALGATVATAAVMAVPLTALPAPTTHAYPAVVSVLAGFIAFHTALAALIAIFAIFRCRAGYVSAVRNLDLRLLRIWAGYTATVGLGVVAAIHLGPVVLA